MPLVVALVDEGIALVLSEVGEHLEAVRVTRNESSFPEESRVLLHAMCDSPSLSGADTFGLGLTRQRVLNDVVRDGFATGASISDVLGLSLIHI